MKKDILCAGFGGQGILLMGKSLARASMVEGMNVTYLPSYGPEMRGGTAHSSVVISDREIASPIIGSCDILVVMNQPSYERFAGEVNDGGVMLVNTSLITAVHGAEGAKEVDMPFTDIAEELGNARVAGMVALGRLVRETDLIALDTLKEQVSELTVKRPSLQALNMKALDAGHAG